MAAIWKELGLHRSTVSESVQRLEELGLVRTAGNGGRGGKTVFITEEGIRRMRRALYLVFGKRTFMQRFRDFFGKNQHGKLALSQFWYTTLRLARWLGDRSIVVYMHKRGSDLWLLTE